MIALNMLTYSIKQNTGTNTKVTVKDNFLLRWSIEGGIPVHQRDTLWDLNKYYLAWNSNEYGLANLVSRLSFSQPTSYGPKNEPKCLSWQPHNCIPKSG